VIKEVAGGSNPGGVKTADISKDMGVGVRGRDISERWRLCRESILWGMLVLVGVGDSDVAFDIDMETRRKTPRWARGYVSEGSYGC